ncbi:hypothetical protein AWJ20_4822 [Sugiyamaella lignohabitans]|uniref:Smr domain-containing protein n=1 Tax=Sugiyamaella lignohabitans TaxID=796027 RepID=A0A167EBH6_9ASCO|nr:uncharacterized protein AWJ20_4822 [Sugiyamaella lignohabitans]ANB13871.1 hypothetical protein AWJ20_4822 [Sugiyamaella lignohabitans]
MDQYNKQAADFVFRANNADSGPDEIDLHGLYVKEAIQALDTRIRAGIQRHESHIKAIVGKGNHSANHVAKIKPAVEELCQTHGIRHEIDPHNSGVIILHLDGQSGPAVNTGNYPQQPPASHGGSASQYYGGNAPQQQPYAPQHQQYQQNYGQQQQQYQQQPQGQGQNNQNDMLFKIFCGVAKMLFRQCA